MHVDVDNSACKKDVKSLKTKLSRKIVFFSGKEQGEGKPLMDQKEYVLTLKHGGVEAFKSEQRTLKMTLPAKDKIVGGQIKGIHEDL